MQIYLFATITMLHSLTTVVGLVVVQYRILDQMEMMKTVQMKNVMMNMVKMLMMNAMEMMRMLKLIDMHHSFELSTKFWRMNKGYMSLHKHHLVMYQITQMMRHWMSHPLLPITYHQHLNFNMLKTWIMLLQVVGLHGCSLLPVIRVENS